MRAKCRKVTSCRHSPTASRPRSLITDHWSLITLSLLLLTLVTGCRLVQTAVNVPGQTVRAVTPGNKDAHAVDPVDVQQKLLRFADEYLTRMVVGVDKLRRGTNALEPAEALKWKSCSAPRPVPSPPGRTPSPMCWI